MASVASDGSERGSVSSFRASLKDNAAGSIRPTLVVRDGRSLGGREDDPRLGILMASVAGDGCKRGGVSSFRGSLKEDATLSVLPTFVVLYGRGLGGKEEDPHLRIFMASVAGDGGERGGVSSFGTSLKDDAASSVPPAFVILDGRGLGGEEEYPRLRIVVASVAGDGGERGGLCAFRTSLKEDATASVPPTLVVLDGRGLGRDEANPRLRIAVASVASDGGARGSIGAFRVSL